MRRGMIAQSLYAIGALLCLVDTYSSITVLIVIQLYFVLGLFSKSPVRRVIKAIQSRRHDLPSGVIVERPS